MTSVASNPYFRNQSRGLPASAAPSIVDLMRTTRRSWAVGIVPVVALIAMLVALAVLQFRWSSEVSEAERDRLQQNLRHSSSAFQSAVARDLLGVCRALQASQPRERSVVADRLFNRYAAWRRISGRSALVEDVYLWPQSQSPAELLRFNLETRKLEPAPWPESLRLFAKRPLPHQPRRWLWDEQVPALVHPVYALSDNRDAKPRLLGYLFVVFDSQKFEHAYVPDLARSAFPASNGFVFQLIESGGNDQRSVVYRSGQDVPAEIFSHPDAVFPLLDEAALRSPGAPVATAASVPVALSVGPQRWSIAVRHRAGSVNAAVASLRRRDLAISIGVLLVFAISLITILIATRRARRLARLQMEFASGVSHELRTPLAVICSAAENLADGIVTGDGKVRDYGAMIHREGQRLSGMVDHILDFAALHSDGRGYHRVPTPVSEVIGAALAGSRVLAQSDAVTLETRVPGDLPLLLTDARALEQCLQNLLSNAIKYGSGGGRVQLWAARGEADKPDRVLIGVRDYGAGIEPEDLPYIFDPFYRGGHSRSSAVRGTGLGLSLTRQMMEALGGRVTVESSPGTGSTFTLEVPTAVAARPEETAPEPSRLA
ncbi:MAG: HAMP domain-containing sensor histidine kinase [Acidobacteriaceae bacterium]